MSVLRFLKILFIIAFMNQQQIARAEATVVSITGLNQCPNAKSKLDEIKVFRKMLGEYSEFITDFEAKVNCELSTFQKEPESPQKKEALARRHTELRKIKQCQPLFNKLIEFSSHFNTEKDLGIMPNGAPAPKGFKIDLPHVAFLIHAKCPEILHGYFPRKQSFPGLDCAHEAIRAEGLGKNAGLSHEERDGQIGLVAGFFGIAKFLKVPVGPMVKTAVPAVGGYTLAMGVPDAIAKCKEIYQTSKSVAFIESFKKSTA